MTVDGARVVWGVHAVLTAAALFYPLAIHNSAMNATDLRCVLVWYALVLGVAICWSYATVTAQMVRRRHATIGAAIHVAGMFTVCSVVLAATFLWPWTFYFTIGMGPLWSIGLFVPAVFEMAVIVRVSIAGRNHPGSKCKHLFRAGVKPAGWQPLPTPT